MPQNTVVLVDMEGSLRTVELTQSPQKNPRRAGLKKLVEPGGIEPPTSTLPVLRSPS